MRRTPTMLVLATAATLAAVGCAPSSDSQSTSTAAANSGPAGSAASATSGGAAGSGSDSASGSASAPAAGGGSANLTVWSWRVEDVEAYNKIFDVYEAAHPGVTITFKAFKATEYNTILATGLAGADGPDVAQVRSYGQLQPTVESGLLVPLDGQVDLSSWDANVVRSAQGKSDGKLYSVPLAVQTLQMFYNKDLFTKAGIDNPPTTWDEFTQDIDKLTQAGSVPMAVGAKDGWTLPIVHQVLATPRYGGQAFGDAVLAGTKKFTDPDYVASLDVVKSLESAMPKSPTAVAYTDAQGLFINGSAAMFPGGSFELGYFAAQNPDLKMGVFQVPAPKDSPEDAVVTPGYADGAFGVSAKSTQQAASMELVKWMATPEFGQLVADNLKMISAVPGVTIADPLLKEMADNYAKSPVPYLLLTDFRYGDPSGTDLMGTGVQELLLGDKDSAAVAQEIQTGLDAWFKPGS